MNIFSLSLLLFQKFIGTLQKQQSLISRNNLARFKNICYFCKTYKNTESVSLFLMLNLVNLKEKE